MYNGETGEARVVTCDRSNLACTSFRLEAINNDANYAAVSGWVTFGAGVTSAEIRVGIVDDTIPELAQDIIVSVGAYEPGDANAPLQNATLTIEANDDPFGSIGFADANLSTFVYETNETQPLRFVLVRTGGALSPALCSWAITPVTGDFSPPYSGTVSFAVGQREASLVVNLLASNAPELSEVFHLSITDVQLGPSLDADRAAATITVAGHNAPYGDFHFSSAQDRLVSEDGGASVRFTVLRSGGLVGDVRVYYSTVVPHLAGLADATPGADYVALNGSLVIADGESSGSFTLVILDDAEPEAEEWLGVVIDRVVLLGNHSGPNPLPTVEAPNRVNVGIMANDAASGVFSLRGPSARTAAENTSIWLDVDRVGGTFGSVTVALRVSFATASPNDIVLPSGTTTELCSVAAPDECMFLNITFGPGQNHSAITVGVVADGIPELAEDFVVAIMSVNGGLADSPPRIGTLDHVDVTIPENDDVRGVLSLALAGPSVVDEGSVVRVDVMRTIGTAGPVSFVWEAVAVSGNFTSDDLTPSTGIVDFADGVSEASFSFTVTNDTIPEGVERFRVVMRPAGSSLGRWDGVALAMNISANDNGYGVFGFAVDSLSVITSESVSGSQQVMLNVSRTVASFGSVSIDWRINLCGQATCASQSDLDPSQQMSGSILFGPGEVLKTIAVLIANDATPERDEDFNVSIAISASQPTPGVIPASVNTGSSTSRIIIATNDDGDGLFGFDAASALQVVQENGGPTVTVTVLRQVAQFGTVHILWSIVDVNGLPATADFATASGVLDFSDGVASANFSVAVIDDNVPELTRDFRVMLATRDAGIGRIQPGASAIIRVLWSEDPLGVFAIAGSPAGVAIADLSGTSSGIRVLNLTVVRTGGNLGDVVVQLGIAYTASDPRVAAANTAFAASLCDTGGARCRFTMPLGVQSQAVSVDLPQSFVVGLGDMFVMTLTSVNHTMGASGPTDSPRVNTGMSSGTLVVAASQADSVVGFVNGSLIETTEGSIERIPITRQSTRGSLVVNWAVSGSDITPPLGTLSFADGEATKTITLNIVQVRTYDDWRPRVFALSPSPLFSSSSFFSWSVFLF